MPGCREENSSAAILATKRLTGVTPEVNLGEHVTYMPLLSTNKAAYSGGFETQMRCYQKSKTEVAVAHKKDLYCPKKF